MKRKHTVQHARSFYLAFQDTLHVACHVIDFHLQLTFLFLQLLLHSLDVVDLVAELGHAVRLLLAQRRGDGLVLQRGLLQVSPQPLKLGLALLVELGLGGGGSSGLLQPLADLLQLPGEVRPLLLDLCPDSTLGLDFLLKFFNTSLKPNSVHTITRGQAV